MVKSNPRIVRADQEHSGIAYGFRVMEATDLDKVLETEQQVNEIPWTRRNFQDSLDSDYECWVMYDNVQHIGHSVLSAAVGEAHLLIISVHADYQGKGLGRILLRTMLNRAVELKAQTIFLEVRESNRVAQQLYLSEGFNEVGRRNNYYPARKGREDAVIMAMEL